MSETVSLVRVRRIDFVCDHCGEGSMSYTGSWWEIHSTGARMHYHRCDVCGFQAAFPVVYPRTEFLQEANQ
jgi:predicted RNA-binding Zn-ribbon protein involved in translation (DUF1610 family)